MGYCACGMAGYAWTFRRKEKGMFEIIHVERVEPRGGYRLALAFTDGTEGERDFADMIDEGGDRCAIPPSLLRFSSTTAF
jgi:hypothetical protein